MSRFDSLRAQFEAETSKPPQRKYYNIFSIDHHQYDIK